MTSIPNPPEGKIGWPWTEETDPNSYDGNILWPKISIVTPSYNQGEFVEETIRSVLLQNYPNLEFIIIDGGSTDNTIEIIKKYSEWVSFWVSEPDNGQSHALNKGFSRATGEIWGYLNTDDTLLPSALFHVAKKALENNRSDRQIYTGPSLMGTSLNNISHSWNPVIPKNLDLIDFVSMDSFFPQPSTFWTNSPLLKFNEDLRFCMDLHYWLNLVFQGYQIKKIDTPLSFYRHHPSAKGHTIADIRWAELAGIAYNSISHFSDIHEMIKIHKRARKRIHHFFRIQVDKSLKQDIPFNALKKIFKISLADFTFILSRPSIGMLKKVIIACLKNKTQ